MTKMQGANSELRAALHAAQSELRAAQADATRKQVAIERLQKENGELKLAHQTKYVILRSSSLCSIVNDSQF